MENFDTLKQVVYDAEEELRKNDEWKIRYAGYARDIIKNDRTIKTVRKQFREKKPLFVYSSISKETGAKKEERVSFDLRYKGQSVATIKYKNKTIFLETKDNTNEHFGIEGGKSVAWKSKEAEIFRSHFVKLPIRNNEKKNNEEHRYESALLTELSKSIGLNKLIRHIQPVRLHKSRFQMPTPFKASEKEFEYSAYKGGGIDLLCRTKHGNKSMLNIFELKDEYENPINVLSQAVKYTVFIHKLLTTTEAENKLWWNIFGFNEIPDSPLILNAVIAMPPNKKGDADKSFANYEIPINGGIIKLHYFYFELINDEDKIDNIETSLFN